jgi:hypothetical protein
MPAAPTASARAPAGSGSGAAPGVCTRSRTRSTRPRSLSVISAPGHSGGRQGAKHSRSARNTSPRIDSTAARYSQAAEPVYQLQPPRPSYGACEYTSPGIT